MPHVYQMYASNVGQCLYLCTGETGIEGLESGNCLETFIPALRSCRQYCDYAEMLLIGFVYGKFTNGRTYLLYYKQGENIHLLALEEDWFCSFSQVL